MWQGRRPSWASVRCRCCDRQCGFSLKRWLAHCRCCTSHSCADIARPAIHPCRRAGAVGEQGAGVAGGLAAPQTAAGVNRRALARLGRSPAPPSATKRRMWRRRIACLMTRRWAGTQAHVKTALSVSLSLGARDTQLILSLSQQGSDSRRTDAHAHLFWLVWASHMQWHMLRISAGSNALGLSGSSPGRPPTVQ